MKFRLSVLVLLIALLAALVPAAVAQDDLNCLGLSADDCTIVTNATAKIAEMQSFTQTYTFDLTLGGLAAMGAPADSISITSDGSGPFVFDTAASAMEQFFDMAMTLNGAISGTGEDASGTISFAIVDGIIYAQNPETGAWQGAALADLLGAAQSGLGGMTGGDSADPMAALNDPAVAGLLGAAMSFDPVNIPGFISQARIADMDMDGQALAGFAYTADIGVLLQSQEFQALLAQAATAASEASPDAAGLATMGPMFAQLASGTFTSTRYVGTADGFVRRIEVNLDLTVDFGAMAGASGGDASQMPPPITIKMNLAVDMTAINDTAAPAAPEGATIVPAEELSGMFGG